MGKITSSKIARVLLFALVDLPILVLENFQWPYWKKPQSEEISLALHRLKKKRFIKISCENDKTIVRITENGKMKVLKYKLEELKIKKPKIWDKRWRIVIFDIPIERKLAREVLRNKLKELGFIALQKSVFIHPYDCVKEIDFIKEIYRVGPYVRFITAESVDNQDELIKRFSL